MYHQMVSEAFRIYTNSNSPIPLMPSATCLDTEAQCMFMFLYLVFSE